MFLDGKSARKFLLLADCDWIGPLKYCLLILALFVVLSPLDVSGKVAAQTRTEIKVPARVRAKMKDLSAVLQMVKLTPLVNDADEVVGVELNEISEKDIINVLKARNGDVIKEVRVIRMSEGKMLATTYPITSAADVMGMYSALMEASRVEVNLKRGKKSLPMTYILD